MSWCVSKNFFPFYTHVHYEQWRLKFCTQKNMPKNTDNLYSRSGNHVGYLMVKVRGSNSPAVVPPPLCVCVCVCVCARTKVNKETGTHREPSLSWRRQPLQRWWFPAIPVQCPGKHGDAESRHQGLCWSSSTGTASLWTAGKDLNTQAHTGKNISPVYTMTLLEDTAMRECVICIQVLTFWVNWLCTSYTAACDSWTVLHLSFHNITWIMIF